MEVVTFSVISAILVQVLCCVSYLWYIHYQANAAAPPLPPPVPIQLTTHVNSKKNKNASKKGKQKNNKPKREEKDFRDDFVSDQDISASSTEKQLAEIIMSEQRSEFIINTTAVNEKPSVKAAANANKEPRLKEQDPEWESVMNKKHKKKISFTNVGKGIFQFLLDEEGGILETPLFEIHFPNESVSKETDIEIEIEDITKFSDDDMEKIFVTPIFRFKASGIDKFMKQFVMKLNTSKTFGRGWSNGLFAQIEMNMTDGEWSTIGRTEYHFGKPVKVTHNSLTSFRAVVTRHQGHQVTRRLNFAAYTNRPSEQDPAFYTIYVFIFDRSPQTSTRVEQETKRFILKIPPKECDFTFGSNLELEVVPTKMFTPSKSEILMKWPALSGANVHAKFQVKLKKTKPENEDSVEFKTMVSFKIWKILPNLETCQEEYFQFYWMSLGGKRRRNKKVLPAADKQQQQQQQQKISNRADRQVAASDGQSSERRKKPNQASNRPAKQEKNISQGGAKQTKRIPNGGLKIAPYIASVKPVVALEGAKKQLETTKKDNDKGMKTPPNTPNETQSRPDGAKRQKYFGNGPNRGSTVHSDSQGHKQTRDGSRQQGRLTNDSRRQQGKLAHDGGRQKEIATQDGSRQQGKVTHDSGRKPTHDGSRRQEESPREGGRQQGKPTYQGNRQQGFRQSRGLKPRVENDQPKPNIPTHGGDGEQASKENVKPAAPKSFNTNQGAPRPKKTDDGAREQKTVRKNMSVPYRTGDLQKSRPEDKLGENKKRPTSEGARDRNPATNSGQNNSTMAGRGQRPNMSQKDHVVQQGNEKSSRHDNKPIKTKFEGQQDGANRQENKVPGQNPESPPKKPRNRTRFRPRIRKESDNKGSTNQSPATANVN